MMDTVLSLVIVFVATVCTASADDYICPDDDTHCLQQKVADLKMRLYSLTGPCTDYIVSTLKRGNTSLYSASSVWNGNSGADRAALNTSHGNVKEGAWSSRRLDTNQYLQIDTVTPHKVVGVATQGSSCPYCAQWVAKYRVMYSTDCENWRYIGGANGQIFDGNADEDTIKDNMFEGAVIARCIRINPIEWHHHIAMRADVIGCLLPLCHL